MRNHGYKHSLSFDVVEDGGHKLFVERVPEYDILTNSWIPSRDFSYRVRETREVFKVDRDLDAGTAYKEWRIQQGPNAPTVQARIEAGKIDKDTLCPIHARNYWVDISLNMTLAVEPKCKKCVSDIVGFVESLDEEQQKILLEEMVREYFRRMLEELAEK